MITAPDFVYIASSGQRMSPEMPRARGEAWLNEYQNRKLAGPCVYTLVPVRRCECCGAQASYCRKGANFRCRKHVDRNPCVVEGCTRTGTVRGGDYGTDHIICGRHWREFVPVGSPERRIYNRFFRRAKKYGWTNESIAAFERFWKALVSRVRARARGDIDMREVNRIMGWENGK